MKSILKYPGAKNRIANWIVSFIPDHEVYLEPYAGSLAVLFNKPVAKVETINDLHSEVVNYFKCLRDCPDELIYLIENTPYSRDEYNSSYDIDNVSDLERARRFCVRCWQGFGCSNTYHNGFKSGQQGNSPNCSLSWSKLPFQLQEATIRLKKVQIENLPALELINRYDTKDVFMYIDPPYLPETRKSHLYKHEMSIQDHMMLLKVLKHHPGRILLSGYDNKLYDSELQGWHKEYKQTRAENGLKRIECLWMNYEVQISLF